LRCGASQPGARGDVKQREFCRCRQVLDVIPDDHSLAGAPGRRRRGKPTDLFVDRLASEPAILSRRPQAARLHTGEQKRRCTRRSSSRSCRRRRGRASSATRRSVIGEGEPVVLSRMSLDLREIPIWGRTTAADCDEPHAATTSCDYVRARAVSRSWLVASSFTRPSGVTTTP
jgi:hypothetical protein